MTDQAAIETSGLTKRYGSVEAIRGVSLRVPHGSICGLLGPNGAGKTTTLKMLIGLTRPSAGEGYVLGRRISDPRESVEIRRRAGFVSEGKELVDYMSIAEAIRFTSAFFPAWQPEIASRCLEIFGLAAAARVATLSKGMKCRLLLLLALARGAEVLLLDEPTDGLDPAAVEAFLQLLVGHVAGTGATVLLSSHRLAEVERVADRIAVLVHGELVLDEAIEDLQARYRRVHLVFDGDIPDAAWAFAVARSGHAEGRTVSLLVRDDVENVIEDARTLHPHAVDVQTVTLAEIFLDTTTRRR